MLRASAAAERAGFPSVSVISTAFQITSVQVDGSGPTFVVGTMKTLFGLTLNNVSSDYAVSRDGQRFLAIVPSEGGSQALTLVQNWTAELKKK